MNGQSVFGGPRMVETPFPNPEGRPGPSFVTRMRAKRAMDLAISVPALVLLLPVFAIVSLAIWLDSRGSAVFRQRRVGKNEELYTLYKFRTMFVGTPNVATAEVGKLARSPITRVGAFLRRASIDELPQLVNVVRGEMSLVGPRPALPSQENVNRLRREAGVEALLPGITGWAQINGRDELGDAEKVAYDAEYLRRQSLGFDLLILVRTFNPVVTGKGNR